MSTPTASVETGTTTEIQPSSNTESTSPPHLTLITRDNHLGAPTKPPAWYYVLNHGILTECSWTYVVCDHPGCTKTNVHGKWVEQKDYPRGPHMPIIGSRCTDHPTILSRGS